MMMNNEHHPHPLQVSERCTACGFLSAHPVSGRAARHDGARRRANHRNTAQRGARRAARGGGCTTTHCEAEMKTKPLTIPTSAQPKKCCQARGAWSGAWSSSRQVAANSTIESANLMARARDAHTHRACRRVGVPLDHRHHVTSRFLDHGDESHGGVDGPASTTRDPRRAGRSRRRNRHPPPPPPPRLAGDSMHSNSVALMSIVVHDSMHSFSISSHSCESIATQSP